MLESCSEILRGLLPRPCEARALPGEVVFPGENRILIHGPLHELAEAAASRLADMARQEFGVIWRPERAGRGRAFRLLIPGGGLSMRVAPPAETKTMGEEGYSLRICGGGACVEAETALGLFWGAMTFRQMLRHNPGHGPAAPCALILDRPRYRRRGFQMDSGRSPNSPAQIRRIIRICSAFKLNCLFFREGDDELSAVRYRTNRLGRGNPRALSIDEMAGIAAFARRHGVTLVPEIESLGHSAAKAMSYPGLVSGGFEHRYGNVAVHRRKAHLDPGNPRIYRLLESVYNEWLPVIDGPFVHLGLDEVALDARAQALHLERLLALVDKVANRHGRRVTPMIWGDAPPTPAQYRGKVVRCLWSYANEGRVGLGNPVLRERQHVREVCAPGCVEPLFMAGGSASGHEPYSKSEYGPAFRNLGAWARWGAGKSRVQGLMAVQWSGNMLDKWLPDFLACADFAWRPPARTPGFDNEMGRIRRHLSVLRDAACPDRSEVDAPAWDGIWLKGARWDRDVIQ